MTFMIGASGRWKLPTNVAESNEKAEHRNMLCFYQLYYFFFFAASAFATSLADF